MMKPFSVLLAAVFVSAAWAADHPPIPPNSTVSGEVLEVKDVDAYTYLRLKTADGETWAAVDKTSIRKGAKVTIENASVMTNFQSRALGRTFDSIVFGNLAGAGASATRRPGAAPETDFAAMHANVAPAADVADVKVAKATGPNARSVEDIATGGASLKDKSVAVRGKVVKFTPSVMGKNWVHLRDGTGSAAKDTHDLLVTTQDKAAVGDIVTATGVVKTDVDLGSGYSFKVLVENATLRK